MSDRGLFFLRIRTGLLSVLAMAAVMQPGRILAGCSQPMRQVQRGHIVRTLPEVRSVTGEYVERVAAGNPETTRFVWQAEKQWLRATRLDSQGRVYSETAWNDSELLVYYPKTTFGYRILGSERLSGDDQLRFIEDQYDWHMDTYSVRQLPSSEIAGRPVCRFGYQPPDGAAYVYRWVSSADQKYSYPLASAMFADTEVYSYSFTTVAFNTDPEDGIFRFRPPRNATLAEYDLADGSLSVVAIRRQMNFRYSEFTPAGTKLPLLRAVRARGIVPAVLSYYRNGPLVVYDTQVKDYGLKLIPDAGLKITSLVHPQRRYSVGFMGTMRFVYYAAHGRLRFLATNMHLHDVLRTLDQDS